jgi:hypothetical protein
MPSAETVAARLQQRRWLGARPGKAADRLALEERKNWCTPLELNPTGTKSAHSKWREAPATSLFSASLDRFQPDLTDRKKSLFG